MKIKLVLLLVFATQFAFAQDSVYARRMVDTLTSPYFWGRGYTNNGMDKAAKFISAQFKSFGLKPLGGSDYIQPFDYPVNTFPGKMEVAINGKSLTPGHDFIIGPESQGAKGGGELTQVDSIHFVNKENRIIVTLESKLTWSTAQKAENYTSIELDRRALKELPTNIRIDAENRFVEDFKTGNICGMVKGTAQADSFVVITCHYDHLGGMGNGTYFPGANDNASGISMLLGLAKYYAMHPQRYSMAFICFSGEEPGLLGSHYFAENPLIPLTSIRFMVNMDIVGTGEEGITVVNASVYPEQFARLKQANAKGHYLVKVNSRGKAANSDHYWFTEKGVPAFYIYTLGGIKAYHDVDDISKTLPLNEYNHLFKLLTSFDTALME